MAQLRVQQQHSQASSEPGFTTGAREELLAQLPHNVKTGIGSLGQHVYSSVIGPQIALYQGLFSGFQQGTQEFQLTMRAIEFHWKYELGSSDVDTQLDKFESFYQYARQKKFEHLLSSPQLSTDNLGSGSVLSNTLANANRSIGDIVGQIGVGVLRAPVDTASALSGLKLMIDYARERGKGASRIDAIPGDEQVLGSVGQGVLDVLLLGAGGLILRQGDDTVRAIEAMFKTNPATKAAFAEVFTEITGQSLVTFASMTGQSPEEIVKAIAVDSLATLGVNRLNRFVDSRMSQRRNLDGQDVSSRTPAREPRTTSTKSQTSSRPEELGESLRPSLLRSDSGKTQMLRSDNSYTPPGKLVMTSSGDSAIAYERRGTTVFAYSDTTSSILKTDGTHSPRGRLLEDPSEQLKVEYTRTHKGTDYAIQEYRDGNSSLVTPRGPTPPGKIYDDGGLLVIGSSTENGQYLLSFKDGSSKIALSSGGYSQRGQLLKDPAGYYKVQYQKGGVTLQELPNGQVAMQKENGAFTLPGTEKVLSGQGIIESKLSHSDGQVQYEIRYAQFRDGRVSARSAAIEGTYSSPIADGSPFVWSDGTVGVSSRSGTIISLGNESGYRVRLSETVYSPTAIPGRAMRLNGDDVIVTRLGGTSLPVAYGNNGTMYVGTQSQAGTKFDTGNPIGVREVPPSYITIPDGTLAIPLRDGNYAIVDKTNNARMRISETELAARRIEPAPSDTASVVEGNDVQRSPFLDKLDKNVLEVGDSTAAWLQQSSGLLTEDARKAAELATPRPTNYGRPSGIQNSILAEQIIGRVREGRSKAAIIAIETPANVKALNSFFHSASEADEVLKVAARRDAELVDSLERLGYSATVRGERGAGCFLFVERTGGGEFNREEIAEAVSRWQVETTKAVYDSFPGIDQLKRARSGDDGAIFGAPVTVSDVIDVEPHSSPAKLLSDATRSRDANMEQMEAALARQQGLPAPVGEPTTGAVRQGRPVDASALDSLSADRDRAVELLYSKPQQFLPVPMADKKSQFVAIMQESGIEESLAQERFNRLTGVINSQSGYISQSYGSLVWANIERAAEAGRNAVVLGTDVANMGGCNTQIGAENVDKLMFGFSNRFILAIKQESPDVEISVVRNGGDEVYFAMVFPDSLSQKQVHTIVQNARGQAENLIDELNSLEVVLADGERSTLGQAKNPKSTSEKPAPPGHSVYWSELLWVEPGSNVVGDIDASVELQKTLAADSYKEMLEQDMRP